MSRWRDALYATPLYDLLLGRSAGRTLRHLPEDPWPGEPGSADRLFQGRWKFGEEEVVSPNEPPWAAAAQRSIAFQAELHGFGWLRHFRTAGGATAQRAAQSLTQSWLTAHARWQPTPWRADITGRRLCAWIGNARFLLHGAEPAFQQALTAALVRQAKHLQRDLGAFPAGPGRMDAALGLVYAALALGDDKLDAALALLLREVAAQILADGGHVTRSPAMLNGALRELVALRAALLACDVAPPDALVHAIDRAAPMLRFFRHGDGGLAHFHGGGEESGPVIDLTLAQADARGRPVDSATQSGFERIAIRRTLVLFDGGPPPRRSAGARPHAGPLAFELSYGKDRLIVNCGAPWRPDGALAEAFARTAAHSTLAIADLDAYDVAGDDRPAAIVTRDERDGQVWVEASHEGWRQSLGLVHRRRLWLNAAGEDLRGEDVLDGPGLARLGGRRYAVRFHLHPSVSASALQGGSVLLRTPGGSGWRFRSAGGAAALEESLYFGPERERRRTQQVVIHGVGAPDEAVSVKWALTKVTA